MAKEIKKRSVSSAFPKKLSKKKSVKKVSKASQGYSSIKKEATKKPVKRQRDVSQASQKPSQTIDLMNRESHELVIDNGTFQSRQGSVKSGEDVFTFEDLEKQGRMSKKSTNPDSIRSNSYIEGVRTIKDCYSPDSIRVVDERTLKIDGKYIRNYVLQGYPAFAQVGWLDELYSYNGNLDTMIYVEPEEARQASQEITRQIAQLQAQLIHDQEKGTISNISKYQQEIARLENERATIEMNTGSFFKVQLFANLFANTKAQLDKDAAMLESNLQGQRMHLMPTALRMIDGYRSTLPTMHAFYEDKYRNMNTGATASMFPFYNAEICHPGGVLLGINYSTGTPMYINMYDKNAVVNTNMSVFGRAGSGKSYFVKLLILRSALQNIHSAIIDPEGEYGQIARDVGGANIEISPSSRSCINVFDIEEAVEVDDDGNPTSEYTVDVNGKVSDLVNLMAVMAHGEITQEQTSLVSVIIQKLYANFGITTDPRSLYDNGGDYDPVTGIFYSSGRRKLMPTFSDFHDLLLQEIERDQKTYESLIPFANQMRMFRKDGAYGLFDCQSTVRSEDFDAYPVINFDVHSLEEGILRPIGMYIAMTYIWEKFVKKNFAVKKRVICDEAWMLMNKGMAGSQYSRQFLEKCARRIRKRNAGLLVASQNFIEFANCDEGQVILSNTAVRIFLKQSDTDIAAVKKEFNLSDGEVQFLNTANLGEFLIKTDTESAVGKTLACPYEHELLTTKDGVRKA